MSRRTVWTQTESDGCADCCATSPTRDAPCCSSHQLNEVQEVADRVVILNRGQLVRSGSIAELIAGNDSVLVRSPGMTQLAQALHTEGAGIEKVDDNTARIKGLAMDRVGSIAFAAGVELHELSGERFDLEDLFFALTQQPAGAPPGMQDLPHPGMQGPPSAPQQGGPR